MAGCGCRHVEGKPAPVNRRKPSPASAPDAARGRLKRTALRLFSERGIDGVSVRDIVSTADMKNGASLHYYFGSKDALIEELVIDCAIRSDAARLKRLEQLEAAGGPHDLSDIIRLLIEAEASLDYETEREDSTGGGHMRFIMALQINHRDLVLSALDGGAHADAYARCVEHIRRFLSDLPAETVRQRMALMYIYIMSTMAAREVARLAAEDHPFWNSPTALDAIVETTCGLLRSPPFPPA